jgi:hypothetical protein
MWTWWLTVTTLMLGGSILAAPLILSKAPGARGFIEKIIPYSVWIGIVVGVGGVLGLLFWIFNLGLIAYFPLLMIQWMLINLLAVAVGLLLTMNLLRTRKEIPQEKLEAINAKLAVYQIPIGMAAVAFSIFFYFYFLVLWSPVRRY